MFALLCAAAWPINRALVSAELEDSEFGRRFDVAVRSAEGRPIVLLLGSSQSRRSLDPEIVERFAFEGSARHPRVFSLAVGGLHPSVYPYALRRILDREPVAGIVLELGNIAQDQYRGAWLVRDFIEDDAVRDAFLATARGRDLVDTLAHERRFPWTATPGHLRKLYDARNRVVEASDRPEELARTRGFEPMEYKKDSDEVVRGLVALAAKESPPLEDASPQHVFVEVARICAELSRERGIPFAVLLQPVNRSLAPRIPIVRHFEETARRETIPAMRALGIEVLVPPDAFFEDRHFSDDVHLRAAAAPAFSDWLGRALRELPSFR